MGILTAARLLRHRPESGGLSNPLGPSARRRPPTTHRLQHPGAQILVILFKYTCLQLPMLVSYTDILVIVSVIVSGPDPVAPNGPKWVLHICFRF